MVKEGIVLRQVTHVAQNTRLNQARVLDFVAYANQQIQTFSNSMDPRCIVNFDDTNINRDLYGSLKLEKHGASQDHWNEDFRHLWSLHCALRCQS